MAKKQESGEETIEGKWIRERVECGERRMGKMCREKNGWDR